MMKFLSITTIFLIYTFYADGYNFHIPAKIGIPGICMYDGMKLQPGDNQMLHKCQIVRCMEDGSMTVEGCDQPHCDKEMAAISPVSMNKLPYPQCCQKKYMCNYMQPNYKMTMKPMTHDYYEPYAVPSVGKFMYQYPQHPYPFMRQQHYYMMQPERAMEMY